mgnify:CR=1 FL=1
MAYASGSCGTGKGRWWPLALRAPAACLLLWLGMALPAAAQSCPSADGAGYTYVDNGTANNYNIGAGQSLLSTSRTSTGSCDGPAAGGLACANAGATFQPSTANNASGTVTNHGTTRLVGIVLAGGFTLDNQAGTAELNGTNANGAITITNAFGAQLNVDSNVGLASGSNVQNNGQIDIAAGGMIDLQSNSTLNNTGRIELNGGDINSAGTVDNTGYVFGAGEVHVNSGTFQNRCSIVTTGIINGGTLINEGYLMSEGGPFTNNGTLTQDVDAVSVGTDFTNSGSVGGRGRYHFSGNTVNQGPFNGAGPATPIVFFDTTRVPPPEFFDVQNTNPTNTLRTSFIPPTRGEALSQCTPEQPDEPQADVGVAKSAVPTSARVGDTVTYTLVVTSAGPDGGEGTVLTDAPGAGLACTAVSCTSASGGAVCPATGSAAGQLSIANLLGAGVELEQLPAGGQIEFEVECTVESVP